MNTPVQKPPQNIDAERCVLGAMMLEVESLESALEILKADYFYHPAHARIFSTMVTMASAGAPCDELTVTNTLRDNHDLDSIGGPGYITGLCNVVPTVENTDHYAKIIIEKAILRQIVSVSNKAIQQALEAKESSDILNTTAEFFRDLDKLLEYNDSNHYAFLEEYQKRIRRAALQKDPEALEEIGLKTGYTGFDKESGGFTPGRLYGLIGRNKHGKTTLALNLGEGFINANPGKIVLFFSLEMTDKAVLDKLVAIRYAKKSKSQNVPTRAIESLSAYRTMPDVLNLGLHFDKSWIIVDKRGSSADEISRKLRRIKRAYPEVGLVLIDYMQKLKDPSGARNYVFYESAVGRLFDEAGESKLPILLLAQAGRGAAREHRMPDDADVYGGDAFDQYADQIDAMLDPYYAKVKAERTFEASLRPREISVRGIKNKYGPCLDWKVNFYPTVGLMLPENERLNGHLASPPPPPLSDEDLPDTLDLDQEELF